MATGGHRKSHRLLLLTWVARQRLRIQFREKGDVIINGAITHFFKLGVHRQRVLLQAHGVAQALAHLLNAVEADKDRQQQAELRPRAEMALQVSPHGHIELLIRPAQLHISIDCHRVVAL